MRLLDTWGELVTGILLIIGLILSLVIGSFVFNTIIILVCGFLVGRLYHLRRHKLGFPFFLISAGFLLGYIFGSEIRGYGNPIVIAVAFFAGCWLGDQAVHRKLCK